MLRSDVQAEKTLLADTQRQIDQFKPQLEKVEQYKKTPYITGSSINKWASIKVSQEVSYSGIPWRCGTGTKTESKTIT